LIRVRLGILIALLPMLCGCAFQRAQEAADARVQLVGLTKEQVFTCMGIPSQKSKEGAVEVWTYPSGNDQVAAFGNASAQTRGDAANAYGTASVYGAATGRLCTVSIAFQQEHVSRVNYVGQTGGLLTQGEQCAYAVRNCLPKIN
jgi:hypothetical protein